MGKIAGTCYIKVDGLQLSATGGVELPMNTRLKEDVIALDGSVDYKETHRAPYTKLTAKVPKGFPRDKLISSENMTVTSELANGDVYVLSNAWVNGEMNYNPEDGTVDIEFHGQEGFYQ
ncbi:phage tail tube protein [Cronobacter sakazakii]|uniref:phage tail tube protein n=1 Tax=Cronobacter TaxID=413496 RepID=UPI000948F025|nr:MULTISPECIES: phage tail tube protein [Cronobacter]NCI18456.1 phage tail protein [Cronobacter muytjensii]EGT4280660.1 phage tail protein [Cronobacter malonaticus]EGT4312868.1 phage tail protein [Cronobacter malonaticus]EGT4334440.1 phage tail protein [Cronobacter malonaticus]EJQ0791440.1 phage tail tube protein [Cronobacter sakazakii]